MVPSLPSPHQVWAHSTCSIQSLDRALSEETVPHITAIEADIVMGNVTNPIPIMAHPPQRDSDLTLAEFLQRTIPGTIHLKLDFKESAVLLPSLDILAHRFQEIQQQRHTEATLFLNADILPGPGYRHCHPKLDADFFISSCLQHELHNSTPMAFSIGWNVDCRALGGYTHEDVKQLQYFIQKYDLITQTQGVVVPVNARILRKNPEPLVRFLQDVSINPEKVQLLIWTGSGEPPISIYLYQYLKLYFEARNLSHCVGYDCQVSRNVVVGVILDILVSIVGFLWNVKRLLSTRERTFLSP